MFETVTFRPSAAASFAARSAALAASLLQHTGDASPSPPSVYDALSGVFGSVSLTAWICLLLPQLIQNYKSQSADGLSMAFLTVWLIGDVTNLSAVALACYFCVADIVLIAQCLYYNTKNARRERLLRQNRTRRRSSSTAVERHTGEDDAGEQVLTEEGVEDSNSPLLARRRSSSIGLPGSHRRRLTRRSESNLDPLRRIITGEDETPDSNPWLHNTLSLIAVWIVGALGYFVSYRMGAWEVADPVGGGSEDPVSVAADDIYAKMGLALGYLSAVCYLCARIPQIMKNYREKSCEGNFTYGASLVAYSQDGEYLIRALPWLLGSLGTIVEDLIIFFQFRLYAPRRNAAKPAASRTAGDDQVTEYGTV
ncbi:hypothetical protein SEPCBS119000_002585 [Sporothrix epigloea]|uniref:Vacuolar membrane pq loop repeat protein n=1 Tax=Sporothrix epigloea TaxID=1892477 RepID=A0ABP0DI88_9PEZI